MPGSIRERSPGISQARIGLKRDPATWQNRYPGTTVRGRREDAAVLCEGTEGPEDRGGGVGRTSRRPWSPKAGSRNPCKVGCPSPTTRPGRLPSGYASFRTSKPLVPREKMFSVNRNTVQIEVRTTMASGQSGWGQSR